MTCREVIDSLGAYVDAEVPDALRGAVGAPLAGCAACRESVVTYLRTVRLAGDAFRDEADDVPEDLVADILAPRRKR